MVSFWPILGSIICRSVASFTRKNDAFGLPKLRLTAACVHAERDREICQAKQKKVSKVQIDTSVQ